MMHNRINFFYCYYIMGAKQFFRKIEKGTKDFFKKGGIAESALRKVGNSLSKAVPVVSKIGEIAGNLAPELNAVPGIGGALASGATAISKATPTVTSALSKLGKGAKDLSRGSRNGIQALKPEMQPFNAFDELPFANE
jgi:hypothetical protein